MKYSKAVTYSVTTIASTIAAATANNSSKGTSSWQLSKTNKRTKLNIGWLPSEAVC